MIIKNSVEYYKKQVKPAIESKVEELRLLGYDRVTEEEVWDCLHKKVWKKNNVKALHEIVEDILTLKVGTYMSYITVKAYQAPDFFSEFENFK
ncbi:post-transcriptional regulator [Bacillus sp. Marseille-P3661]|uniref:post-transcriptional regulator n=1 Tax=Bacillus sp. Marseille-P3661 TaxID=1936234 RepID=UPI000C84DF67|nr:post-transcriptional regulator [Bacillus sp. Marseille-P3661]